MIAQNRESDTIDKVGEKRPPYKKTAETDSPAAKPKRHVLFFSHSGNDECRYRQDGQAHADTDKNIAPMKPATYPAVTIHHARIPTPESTAYHKQR
jgi:hypothetical protein